MPVNTTEEIKRLEARVIELKRLVKLGEKVVEDFLPNVGNCVLQDYGRLNEFLIRAKEVQF